MESLVSQWGGNGVVTGVDSRLWGIMGGYEAKYEVMGEEVRS